MDLTKEALQLFLDTAKTAAGARVLKIEGDPDTVLIDQDGETSRYELPPKHRNHAVLDIDSLLDLADRNCAYDEAAKSCAILWHSEEAIVLVFDDETRRDFATLKLQFSSVYSALRSFAAGRTFEQRDLIHLLKTTFSDCAPPDLIASVRTIKFSKTETGGSELNHGQASLGRQVEAKIVNADQIAESFVVTTNVYANVLQDQTVQVRVGIELDLEKHTFILSILGDDLTTSMLLTQEALAERLAEGNDQRRVLFGRP